MRRQGAGIFPFRSRFQSYPAVTSLQAGSRGLDGVRTGGWRRRTGRILTSFGLALLRQGESWLCWRFSRLRRAFFAFAKDEAGARNSSCLSDGLPFVAFAEAKAKNGRAGGIACGHASLRFAELARRDAPSCIRTHKAALCAWVLIPPASVGTCRGFSWHFELPHLELHEVVGLAGVIPQSTQYQ